MISLHHGMEQPHPTLAVPAVPCSACRPLREGCLHGAKAPVSQLTAQSNKHSLPDKMLDGVPTTCHADNSCKRLDFMLMAIGNSSQRQA
jgi:hypothetical protein